MKRFRCLVKTAFIALLCAGAQLTLLAQKGNVKSASGSSLLSEQEQEANSAMFVDAVKERLCENYELAEEKLHRVILADSQHAAAHYELAVLMVLKGEVKEALLQVNRAAKLNPDNQWYQVMMGDLYNQTLQFDKSVPVWKRLSENFPENLEYLNNYAFALLQQHKLKEAVAVYDRMQQQIGPDEELVEAKKNIYLYLNKVEQAAQEIIHLSECYPNDPKYLVEVADIYRTNGKMKKAVPYLEAACRLDSNNPQVLTSLYDYYVQKEQEEQAYRLLKKIFASPDVPLEPKRKVMANYFLRFLQENKQNDKYGDQLSQLIGILLETHPKEASLWAQQSDILVAKGKYGEAITALEHSLSLDSSVYKVWQAYLQLLVHEGRDETCDEAERAKSLFPMQPYPYVASGWCLWKQQDYWEAAEELERALRLIPEDGDLEMRFQTYGLLSTVYEALGEKELFEKATKEFERCTEMLYPKSGKREKIKTKQPEPEWKE